MIVRAFSGAAARKGEKDFAIARPNALDFSIPRLSASTTNNIPHFKRPESLYAHDALTPDFFRCSRTAPMSAIRQSIPKNIHSLENPRSTSPFA